MRDANLQSQRHPTAPGPFVLIVEDERGLRGSLATYLRRKGVTPLEAGSLQDASLVLNDQAIDVLVLDVGLPDGSGLSLLETVPAERCLVISADPNAARFASAGVRHWLAKPLDLCVFWSTVHRLAEAASLAEEAQGCRASA